MARKNLVLALENEEVEAQKTAEEIQSEGSEPVTGDAIEQVPAEPEATPVEAPLDGEAPAEEPSEAPAEDTAAPVEEPKDEATVEESAEGEVSPEEGEGAAEVSETISPESFEDEEMEEATEEQEETEEEVLAYAEEAYDDIQTLDAIQDTMERSVEEGNGLDETAAQITEIAVEAIRVKLGLKTATQDNFALESFKTKGSTRLDATRLAIEAIEDQKQTIWQRIVAAFKLLLSKIVEFIGSIFDSLPILKKKLEKMKDTLAHADIVEPTDESKHSASVGNKLAKAFSVDGKVNADTVETISGNAVKFIELSVVASKQVGVAAHVLTQSLSRASILDAKEFFAALNDALHPAQSLNGLTLVNNKVIKASMNDEELRKGKLGISIDSRDSEPADGEQVPVLSSKETQTMLDDAITIIDQAMKYKDSLNKLKVACNEILKQKIPEVKKGEGMNLSNYSHGTYAVNHYISFLSRLPLTNAYETANAIGTYAASNMAQMTGQVKQAA